MTKAPSVPLTKASARTGQLETKQAQETPEAPSTFERVRRQAPNAITLAGYALGLWWSVGGPTWAAIMSILADELDGRLARSLGVASSLGANLDSTVDAALVPMTLLRFGRATNLGAVPLLAAPPILLYQAQTTRNEGYRPPIPIGSWRAGIMLATILAESVGSLRRVKV